MKKQETIFISINVLFTIGVFVFELVKFDLAIVANASSLGTEIVLGWLGPALQILYVLVTVGAIVYAVRMVKSTRWRAFIPITLSLVTIILLFIYPMTNFYFEKNYTNNLDDRIKTIDMIENQEISEYQINQDVYIAPFRHTSCTGEIYVQERNGITKAMFFVYQGFGISKIIVYVSDDSGIDESDFNFGIPEAKQMFSDITKRDANWYSAKISQ